MNTDPLNTHSITHFPYSPDKTYSQKNSTKLNERICNKSFPFKITTMPANDLSIKLNIQQFQNTKQFNIDRCTQPQPVPPINRMQPHFTISIHLMKCQHSVKSILCKANPLFVLPCPPPTIIVFVAWGCFFLQCDFDNITSNISVFKSVDKQFY